ncbi:GNAT family N-acetyltransferase [Nocardia nova]|uniref:GNAT family N-acetyltransferase n=1 Tax=Nocardia nova TaxID=37330 RepID=UPI0033C5253E
MPRLTPLVLPRGALSGIAQPTIRVGHGLGLRPWRNGDAWLLVEVYSDPTIQRWHCRTFADRAEAAAMIAGWQQEWILESGAHWAITNEDGAVVGRVALRGMDFGDGTAGVSYWVVPRWRGRGVVPAAVIALTGWAFDRGFRRLALEHSVANRASCRVAQKAGFRYEGTLAAAARHLDGHHDMHLHAITGAQPLPAPERRRTGRNWTYEP